MNTHPGPGAFVLEAVRAAYERGESQQETALRMRVGHTTIMRWRKLVGIMPVPKPRHVPDESQGPGCGVCGLHGEHVCLRGAGRADDRRSA
jgi:hypothetical protein